MENPTQAELNAFFGTRTASLHDSIFAAATTASTPARTRGNAARMSHGAAATPRIKAPGGGAGVKEKIATSRFVTRVAEQFHESVATLVYDGDEGVFKGAAGFVDVGEGEQFKDFVADGKINLDIGTRATRGPLPYSIALWLEGNVEGRVGARCLREETEGAFVTRMSPSRGFDVTNGAGRDKPLYLYFWAAPIVEGADGEKVTATVEVRVGDVRLNVVLHMCGAKACFDVAVDDEAPNAKATNVAFAKGEAADQRMITMRNLTAGDAPLLLCVVLEDSAGGSFSLVDLDGGDVGDPVNTECTGFSTEPDEFVFYLDGQGSRSFGASYDVSKMRAYDSKSLDFINSPDAGASPTAPLTPSRDTFMGLAKIMLPSFVSGSRARSVDKDLLHYFDHVIDLVRPGGDPVERGQLERQFGEVAITPGPADTSFGSDTASRNGSIGNGLCEGLSVSNSALKASARSGDGAFGEDVSGYSNFAMNSGYGFEESVAAGQPSPKFDRELGEARVSGALSVDLGDDGAANSLSFDSSNNFDIDYLAAACEDADGTAAVAFHLHQSTNSMLQEYGIDHPLSEYAHFPDTGPQEGGGKELHKFAEQSEEANATVSQCLPLPEIDDHTPNLSHHLTRPRLKLPRRIAEAGMICMDSHEMIVELPLVNPGEVPLQIRASLSKAIVQTGRVALTLPTEDVIIVPPGERCFIELHRTARGAACDGFLSLRCTRIDESAQQGDRTPRQKASSAKYRFPLSIQELPQPKPSLVPTGFATDRPSMAFYGCAEMCTEGIVKMASVIRVFNGTSESAPFSARIVSPRSFGTAGSSAALLVYQSSPPPGGAADEAAPFVISGDVPDFIAPLSIVDLTVLFCAPTDESYYAAELELGAGAIKQHQIPLFGYGGSADIRTFVQDQNDVDKDDGIVRCLVENHGTRSGCLNFSLEGFAEEDPVDLEPGESLEIPVPLPTYEDTGTSREWVLGKITARDSILESRAQYSESGESRYSDFDWASVHPNPSAFHYDGRISNNFAWRASLLVFCEDIGRLTVRPDPEFDSDSVRPEHNFDANYCGTQTIMPSVGDSVVVYNFDARASLEFSATGTEPARGRVPPLGEALLHVCGAHVAVNAPGRGRCVLEMEDMLVE